MVELEWVRCAYETSPLCDPTFTTQMDRPLSNPGSSFYPGSPFRCTEAMEACDGDAEAGYTEDYVPETGIIVTEQYDTDFLEGDDRLYINTTTTVNCQAYYNSEKIQF